MSSPLGHAFAGVAAAWAADLIPGFRRCRLTGPVASFLNSAGGTLTLVCAGLAVLPDFDLAFHSHRTATHSVTAVAVVTILSAVVTRWVTGRRKLRATPLCSIAAIAAIALVCGAAYATHLLLDWLAVDATPPRGIQIFWPFSQQFYLSGLNLFPRTERRRILSAAAIRINMKTMGWEVAILVPILALLWFVRVKTLARLASETTGGNHPAK